MHAWLLRSRVFGPVIRDWEKKKCISMKVKMTALTMMAVVGGTSIFLFVPPGWPRLAGLGMIALGCLVVLFLKACPGAQDQDN